MVRLRRLRLRLLCLSLLVAAGGGSAATADESAPQPGGLSRIVDSGEIRVGTSGEQPPLSMVAKNGALLGLDVALARVLASSMGVDARFVQMPFGQLLGALEKGEVDIVMSGVTITPKRATRVSFVGPYYTSGKSILTKSPDLAAMQVAADLDSPKLRFAALAGSTSEDFAERELSSAKLVTSEYLDEAVKKVIDGKVDALVADRETCAYAVLRYPNDGLIVSQASFTVEPMGIAVSQNDPRLTNLIQTYLTALGNSGALERAKQFWFKDSSWVKDLR